MNVAAALRVAAALGDGATVVTAAVDSGLKYISTDLYPRTTGGAGA
jgi:cysteine synthase